MNTTVNFQNVGHDKKTWSQDFTQVTEESLERAVRKSGAIMSSEIDCIISENGTTGEIIVGGWRSAGTFSIGKKELATA